MKAIKKIALIGTSMLALVSCGEKDQYDPNYSLEVLKAEYSANFVKKYGTISPTQTWDFTSGPTYYFNRGTMLFQVDAATRATRAEYAPTVSTSQDYYEVEKNTLTWLTNKLKEGKDNRELGKPFVMSMPGNSFTIVPIYQGQAAMAWDLHMVVGDGTEATDVKIWSKSQDIQTSQNGKDWTNLSSKGNTLSADHLRAKQYTVDNVPVGTSVHFYLEVTVGSDSYAKKGTKQSSLSGMMLTLSCPRPNNLSDDKEVLIIGCEDANLKGSDWDLNDVVFLVYGNPETPKPIEITDNQVVQKVEKRYMIEDLGTTDDFDFNDVVVDVQAERTVTYTLVNGVVDYDQTKYSEWKQSATVQHLGGTLPFQLKIGNTTLAEMQGQLDVDLTEKNTFTVGGWDPELNNVSITVSGSNKSEAVKTIGFPKAGEAPMIIAFDKKTEWMPERQSIPAEWFTTE